MIKFEFNYDGSELISKGEATLSEVAQDICNKTGVELSSTSFLNSNKKVSVYDNTITAREYIGYIAESAGCFACIDREGKLCFREFGQDETEIPLEMFGEYKWGEEFKISKVSYEDGVRSFKFGDDTRNNLWINQENMYIVDEDQVQKIYNKIKDLTVNTFEGKVIIDPAIDIGDKIVIDGKNVIYQGEMSLEGRFIAQISSKIQIKQKEETTVKKESQKVVNRRVQSRINQAEGKIEQLVEETTENSEKLTKHEQTIDSMKDTLKSQETKIETVDSKANKAQSTADTATTKANNAQTSADNAQTIANTANTNAQKAQKTANANTTKITTNTTKIVEVEKTVNGITQSVSEVKTEVKTVDGKADKAQTTAENAQSTANTANTTANTAKSTAETAKSTADSTNKNLTTNYYTKTETNSQITQKAESITSEVSKTYSTKTETSTAKTEAINSANSSTDNKLKGYTETSKLGTAIEQNYEHVKVAWNQISDFIQMMIINNNASLAILDKDKKVMMALDKAGQHFYKDDGTEFGEMGVNTIDNQNYISFGVTGNYGQEISDGMAWGITTKKDNKFWPILYIKNFVMSEENSDGSYGELVLSNCNLVLDGIGTGMKSGGVFLNGDPTGFGLYFWDEETNKSLLAIHPKNVIDYASITILDNIKFYANQAGSNSFRLGTGSNYCLFTDEGSVHCSNIIISDGSNLVSINSDGEVAGSNLNFYGLPSYQGKKLVYGQDGHMYYLDWTGSKLNFWVDTTNVGTLSDKRLKTEIQDIDEDSIKAIEEIEMKQFKVANRNGLISFGILAQDLIEIFKKHGKKPFDYEIVYKTQFRTDDDTVYYAINYEQFLILKQKAMDKKLEQLQSKDKQKDELIQSLIQRIETLEKEVNK